MTTDYNAEYKKDKLIFISIFIRYRLSYILFYYLAYENS